MIFTASHRCLGSLKYLPRYEVAPQACQGAEERAAESQCMQGAARAEAHVTGVLAPERHRVIRSSGAALQLAVHPARGAPCRGRHCTSTAPHSATHAPAAACARPSPRWRGENCPSCSRCSHCGRFLQQVRSQPPACGCRRSGAGGAGPPPRGRDQQSTRAAQGKGRREEGHAAASSQKNARRRNAKNRRRFCCRNRDPRPSKPAAAC